jgi:predicted nucleic acid-binding protein
VETNAAVQATAGAYMDPMLRSLAAIHLATAEFLIGSDVPVTAFVTYDRRLAEAAGKVGLDVVAPAPTT